MHQCGHLQRSVWWPAEIKLALPAWKYCHLPLSRVIKKQTEKETYFYSDAVKTVPNCADEGSLHFPSQMLLQSGQMIQCGFRFVNEKCDICFSGMHNVNHAVPYYISDCPQLKSLLNSWFSPSPQPMALPLHCTWRVFMLPDPTSCLLKCMAWKILIANIITALASRPLSLEPDPNELLTKHIP